MARFRWGRFIIGGAVVIAFAPVLLWLTPEPIHLRLVTLLPRSPAYFLIPLATANSVLIATVLRRAAIMLLGYHVSWGGLLGAFGLSASAGIAVYLLIIAGGRHGILGPGSNTLQVLVWLVCTASLVVLHPLLLSSGSESRLRHAALAVSAVPAVLIVAGASGFQYLIVICFGCGWALP